MAKGLWSIPNVEGARTPLSILKEQGNALYNMTGGSLGGEVTSTGYSSKLAINLSIIVYSLNRYRYSFITYEQEIISIYPGSLSAPVVEISDIRVNSEAEFDDYLRRIIESPQTNVLLSNLLAQAKGAEAS